MKRSKRSNPVRSFGLAPGVAIAGLIFSVASTANEPPAYGPEPRKAPPASPPSAAATAPQPQFKLVEIFSVEQNPGVGTLTFQSGKDPVENIAFGAEAGLYALAMAFKGKQLPEQYGKNFAGDIIVQIAMGTLRSRLEGQVPQFAAATLIGGKLPSFTTRYPIVVPEAGKKNPMKTMALLLFTLPKTPNEITDEQKLRSTFFAQGGYFDLVVSGKPKIVDVLAQNRPLRFKAYPIEMTAKVTLGTPFSAQQATLKGKIQFPLYAPHGKPAEEFTQRIAGESLEGTIHGKEAGREIASPKGK